MAVNPIGLFAGDVAVLSCLRAGLQELRVRPDLLDFAWAWLVNDELTAHVYGQSDLDQARKWFLATDIKVLPVRLLDQEAMPCVTVAVLSDSESANKLDDRHYDTSEALGGWPNLCDPFVPTSYDPSTGIMGLPPATVAQVWVVAGQLLVDQLGRTTRVLERRDASTIRIAPRTVLEVSGLIVRGQYPPQTVALRSAYFDEAYSVGCHDSGDDTHTTWLYTLVKFVLLRCRRRLLEARGLEMSSISGSDYRSIEILNAAAQPGTSRYISVRGRALNVWPDDEAPSIESVRWGWTFSARGSTGETPSSTDVTAE